MKEDKTKVISVRVNEDVANLIEEICSDENISKSEFLIQMLRRNLKKMNDAVPPLKRLLLQLKRIPVLSDTNPEIITLKSNESEDGYEGVVIYIDDTEIREKDGKFYVFDYHKPKLKPIYMDENEILDFYTGQYTVYGHPPSIEHGDSYHFVRGYHQVMSQLMEYMKEELENYQKND